MALMGKLVSMVSYLFIYMTTLKIIRRKFITPKINPGNQVIHTNQRKHISLIEAKSINYRPITIIMSIRTKLFLL